jgi:hypothetical protein
MMILSVELSKPMAEAIIEMDDIAYGEGQGPRAECDAKAWQKLLEAAEFVAGRKAASS